MCRYDNNTSVVKFHFTTSSTGQQIVCTSTVPMYIFEEDTQDKLTCSPLGKKTYVLVGQNNVPSRRQRNKGLRTFQPHRSTLWPRGNVPIVEIPLRRKLISTICYFIFLTRQQENTGGDFAHVQRQNLFRWCQSSPKTGQRGNVSGTSILFKDDQFFFYARSRALLFHHSPHHDRYALTISKSGHRQIYIPHVNLRRHHLLLVLKPQRQNVIHLKVAVELGLNPNFNT